MAEPQYIGPLVDWAIDQLKRADPELPFVEYRKSWTGVVVNWPPCAVCPRSSDFDPEGDATHSEHRLTVKFGVNGEPEQIEVAAVGLMKRIDDAIKDARNVWLPQMSRVYVERHDYGALWEKNGSFAKFPELHLVIETYEDPR